MPAATSSPGKASGKPPARTYTITELAHEFDITPQTIADLGAYLESMPVPAGTTKGPGSGVAQPPAGGPTRTPCPITAPPTPCSPRAR